MSREEIRFRVLEMAYEISKKENPITNEEIVLNIAKKLIDFCEGRK